MFHSALHDGVFLSFRLNISLRLEKILNLGVYFRPRSDLILVLTYKVNYFILNVK